MIRCIAIDDEPLALKKLVAYISKVPYLELVGQFRSARQAQQFITSEEQAVEAIFLDINMPDLNGMDFAKSLQHDHSKGPIMVFTTAYSEYAIEGYKATSVSRPSATPRPRSATTAPSMSRATTRLCASASTTSATSRP